jgi:prepilin-type processing-associated H-X9-DG protein
MATPPAAPKTSGLAVASLVMGLMCMTCVLWPFLVLPAIICGIIALVKISGQRGALRGTGMAVTGIVIPTVMILFIPIFAMLAGILMPALAKTKHIAQRVVCNTNVKGLATAMIVYQNDYDDKFPTPNNWCDLLIQEADVSPKSFQCPLDCEGAYSYAVNKGLYTIETDKLPAQMVMLFESNLGKNAAGGLGNVVLRHDEHGQSGCNIAFADGHVEFVTEDRIPDLLWEAE